MCQGNLNLRVVAQGHYFSNVNLGFSPSTQRHRIFIIRKPLQSVQRAIFACAVSTVSKQCQTQTKSTSKEAATWRQEA